MQLVLVVSQLLVAQSETIIPSSVASTANTDHYPVDNIVTSMPYSLVIRYGSNNHQTREVATSKVIQEDLNTMVLTFLKTTAE